MHRMCLLSDITEGWASGWSRHASPVALALLVAFGCCANSQASITLDSSWASGRAALVDADKFLESIKEDLARANAGRAGHAKRSIESPDSSESTDKSRLWSIAIYFGIGLNPSSGNSTSSAPSGGTGSSSGTPIDSLAVAVVPNLDRIGWVSGEARLVLPLPPGIYLLRPPQLAA